jgi:pimeloyl-ACP methyl ester carboxylesterase
VVRGGTGGIAAHVDDLRTTGQIFCAAAEARSLDLVALREAQALTAATAVLDPAGAARVELLLVASLDGPHGISAVLRSCHEVGVLLQAAARHYAEADAAAAVVGPLLHALEALPGSLARAGWDVVTGRIGRSWQDVLTGDPELADLLERAAVGGDLAAASATAATLYPDGRPQVDALGSDATETAPPRSVADLLTGLARRDDGRHGEIDVRILSGAATGGPGSHQRRVIVDIPGAKDWDVTRRKDSDVTNLGTSLRALAGEPSTYEAGVIDALRQAGVRPDDDVLLVGHSQGGMVAVNAARDLAGGGEFHVSHVITAGAPIGIDLARLPDHIQVLALENAHDIVPHLDAITNPDRPNITTVTISQDHGGVGANHELATSYLPAARLLDSSDDPSIRAFVTSIQVFLTGSAVTTQTYLVTRTFS